MRQLACILISLCTLLAGCAAEPMAGGYRKVPVTDKGVIAAAEFAIKAQSKAINNEPNARHHASLELLKILGAEEQVVAGTNYRLTLRVNENDQQKTVTAIVWWQPWRRPNPYELTSWK